MPAVVKKKISRRAAARFFAQVEGLEQRRMMSATISGKIVQDLTGNGQTSDDTGMGAVTVNLYKDANNNGKLDLAEGTPVATTMSASGTGAYSFGGLAAGRYFVKEASPSNSVRTGPATSDNYNVLASGSNTYSGKDFANFIKNFDKGSVTGLTYTVNGNKVTSLNNVHNGDVVTVSFTLSTSATMSLVDYDVPALPPVILSAQKVDQFSTQSFTSGRHSLTIKVEDCGLFQIDLVGGNIIDHFGPAGSNISYSTQARLIANGSGGQICIPGELCGYVFVDTDHSCLKFPDEEGINNVLITLTGTTHSGESVSETTHTDANGFYCFTDLDEGTYKVVETQPSGFVHEGQMAGTFGGIDTVSHIISVIPLPNGGDGENYNFCETVPPPPPPPPNPGISIVKLTNGANDPDPNGSNVPVLVPGAAVTWSYLVTNTGNVPFAKSIVEVTDNQPGVTPTPKLSGGFVVGDANDNNILDPGETWTYQAMGTAVNLSNPPAGVITVPSGNAGPIATLLGSAAKYAVVAPNGFNINGPGTINGDVASGNQTVLTNPAVINGKVFYSGSISGNSNPTGGEVSTNLSQVFADAKSAQTKAFAMTATQTFGNINNATTINGNGGTNVINMSGINLSNGALTLNGSASDIFILNVSGSLTSSNSNIAISGGVLASHVLINVSGNVTITGGGPNNFYGTILDPNGAVNVHDKLLTGEVIGNTITDTSGFSVNFVPPPPGIYENIGTVTIDGTSLMASYVSNYRNPA